MIFRDTTFVVAMVLAFSISNISSAASFGNGSRIMKNLHRLVRSKGKICPRRMTRLCKREENFTHILQEAVTLAVHNCHEQFKFTRWNCTLDKTLFDDVSRETSVATAIIAASLTHVFAKSCVTTTSFNRCDKFVHRNVTWTKKHWEIRRPSDDIKFGRRMARRILIGPRIRSTKRNAGFKEAITIHNIEVGLKAADTTEENCECYGYSSSCMVQSCGKKLRAFKHTAKLLRGRYTEARMMREAEAPDRRRLLRAEKNRFYYVTPSPNFCRDTHGRECKDETNCSVLCCARGFKTRESVKRIKPGPNRRNLKCVEKNCAVTKFYCK